MLRFGTIGSGWIVDEYIHGAKDRLFRFIEIPPKGARPLSKGCVSLSSSLYNIWGTQRKERHKFNFPPPAN